MFLKNAAGRDSVWEAEQRGNEELVGWMLGVGEEKPEGEVKEVVGEEVEEEEEGEIEEVTMTMGMGATGTNGTNATQEGGKDKAGKSWS